MIFSFSLANPNNILDYLDLYCGVQNGFLCYHCYIVVDIVVGDDGYYTVDGVDYDSMVEVDMVAAHNNCTAAAAAAPCDSSGSPEIAHGMPDSVARPYPRFFSTTGYQDGCQLSH